MQKKLYEKALILKDALEAHPDVVLLKTLESAMEDDATCATIMKYYREVEHKLNDLLEYANLEAPEVKAMRSDLSKIKYELDCNERVIEYNKQYKIVSALYKRVSSAIFDDYCAKKGCSCL